MVQLGGDAKDRLVGIPRPSYRSGARSEREGFLYMAAWPSAKSLVRIRIEPWREIREELHSLLRGWQSYFCYGTLADAYGALYEHVQRRVWHFLQRRHRRTQGRETGCPLAEPLTTCEPVVKSAGKPDAGDPHVRFDERGWDGTGPGQKCFEAAAFAIPAQNRLGNAGRNILQGPRFSNLDAARHRDFRLREGMSLTLRVESFNFTNPPHYSNPNGNAQSPQFGEVNGADQDQRQYQIGLTPRF